MTRKYSIVPYVKKTKKSKKKTAVTKEIKKEVKKQARQLGTSKYFNTQTLVDLCGGSNQAGGKFFASGNFGLRNWRIMVMGFCTTSNQYGPDLTNFYTYGVKYDDSADQIMTNLFLARCEEQQDKTDVMSRNSQYVTPSLAKTTWLLNRVNKTTSTDAHRDNAAPIKIRMIRAVPRTSSGQNLGAEECDPNTDLFVDEVGQPIGVGGAAGFSIYEMELYKTNKRKYKIVSDKTFVLNTPDTHGTNYVTLGVSPHEKKLECTHNIGKKIFYKDADAVNPTAGAKNEFILFHAWYPSLKNISDSDHNMENQLRLGCKAVSTFKDI